MKGISVEQRVADIRVIMVYTENELSVIKSETLDFFITITLQYEVYPNGNNILKSRVI